MPAEPVSERGDVWLLGRHRLVCGDSTDAAVVAKALNGARPHLMVTDPPYGVEYDPAWRNRAGLSATRRTGKVENDDRADWREAWALFPGEVAYVWHGALHAAAVAESLEACGFDIRAQIVWAKDRLVLGRGHYHWQHEPCWYAVKGAGHWSGDRKQTTLWQIASRGQDAETAHGTQKPVECMRRPIENNSSPGPGGLRAVLRLRHHDHRRRDERARLPRHRADRRPTSMWRSSAGRTSPASRRCSRATVVLSTRSRRRGGRPPWRADARAQADPDRPAQAARDAQHDAPRQGPERRAGGGGRPAAGAAGVDERGPAGRAGATPSSTRRAAS